MTSAKKVSRLRTVVRTARRVAASGDTSPTDKKSFALSIRTPRDAASGLATGKRR